MLVGRCQFAGWEDNRGSLVWCKGWHGQGSALPGAGHSLPACPTAVLELQPNQKSCPGFLCLPDPGFSEVPGQGKGLFCLKSSNFSPDSGRGSRSCTIEVSRADEEKGKRGWGSHILPPRQHFVLHPQAPVNIPLFPGTAEPFPVSLFSQERFSAGHVLSIRSISSMYVWFCFCLLAKPGNYNYY